jgi:hypothetical protein
LEENHLAVPPQGIVHPFQEKGREDRHHAFLPAQIGDVHQMNGRLLIPILPSLQPNISILTSFCIMERLYRRCRTPKHYLRSLLGSQDDGNVTGMVARRRLLLPIARIVFLVDDHQPQIAERKKNGGAYAHYKPAAPIPKQVLPKGQPFIRSYAGMEHTHAVAEMLPKAGTRFSCVGHLRQKVKHLAAGG